MITLLLFIGFLVIFSILRGVTLDVFWDWFISGPTAPFHGSVPSITLVQALGISLLVAFLTFQPGAEKDNEGKGVRELVAEQIGVGVVLYVTFWVFAIIYHALAS